MLCNVLPCPVYGACVPPCPPFGELVWPPVFDPPPLPKAPAPFIVIVPVGSCVPPLFPWNSTTISSFFATSAEKSLFFNTNCVLSALDDTMSAAHTCLNIIKVNLKFLKTIHSNVGQIIFIYRWNGHDKYLLVGELDICSSHLTRWYGQHQLNDSDTGNTVQCDVTLWLLMSIKAITSVYKALTDIITSTTFRPIGLSVVLVIMSVPTFCKEKNLIDIF